MSRFVVFLLFFATASAYSAESVFSVEQAKISLQNDVYYLDAGLSLPIKPAPLAAIKNGVPIYIEIDIGIYEKSDWWFDDKLASINQRYKIEYFELARLYQLTNLNTQKKYTYPFLGAVLLKLGTIKHLPLVDKVLLKDNKRYYAEIKVDLLISKLPLPLIPMALVGKKWEQASSVRRLSLR